MDIIKEINEKYLALEAEVDSKLEKVKREEKQFVRTNAACLESSKQNPIPKVLTYEEAMLRNVNLLKSLELVKARLRSRSTFSPVEQILEKTLRNYKMDLEQSQNEINFNRQHYTTETIYDAVL